MKSMQAAINRPQVYSVPGWRSEHDHEANAETRRRVKDKVI